MEQVSLNNRPMLIMVDSEFATNPNLLNSNLTFNMPETVSPRNAAAVGLISLVNFNCKNVFHNISSYYKNNVFKLLCQYYDNSTTDKTIKSITVQFTLPNGFYTISELLTYMNDNFYDGSTVNIDGSPFPICFGCTPVGVVGYEIGSNGLDYYPYPPTGNIRIITQSSIYSQGVSIETNTLTYKSISIIVDADTVEFLSLIGLFQNSNNINFGNNDFTVYFSAYSAPNDSGTLYSLYSSTFQVPDVTSPNTLVMVNPYQYELDTIRSLNISLENTISQNRITFNSLSQSDILFSVPIESNYLESIIYQSTLEKLFSYVTNLNLTSLTFNIFDQKGRFVNFRGANWSCTLNIRFGVNDDASNEQPSDLNLHLRRTPLLDPQAIINPLGNQQDPLFPKKRFRKDESIKNR